MGSISTRLGLLIGFLVIIYFLVYASACPSKELVSAVAVESAMFVMIAIARLRKKSAVSMTASDTVIDELLEQCKVTGAAWKFWKAGAILVLSTTVLLLSIDLCALTAAFAEKYSLAKAIYLANPVYRIPGVNPALSAELLAGAFVESGNLGQAERLSFEILEMTNTVLGPNHTLSLEMYGNLAGIYVKQGKPALGERYARKALESLRRRNGNHHVGNVLTKLASALRDQGHFAEAEMYYLEALAMREIEYGKRSEKVEQTLVELEKLHVLIADPDYSKLEIVRRRLEELRSPIGSERSGNALSLLIWIAACMGFSFVFFGPRGIFTQVALSRIKSRVDADIVQADRRDLTRLIALYKFRKEPVMLEYYEHAMRK